MIAYTVEDRSLDELWRWATAFFALFFEERLDFLEDDFFEEDFFDLAAFFDDFDDERFFAWASGAEPKTRAMAMSEAPIRRSRFCIVNPF